MRRNALAALASGEALLGDLRGAFLVNSPAHGQLRVRDVEVALGRLPAQPGAEVIDMERIRAQLRAALEAGSEVGQALDQAVESTSAMRGLLADKVDVQERPDLEPLAGLLAQLKRTCDEARGVAVAGAETSADAGAPAASPRGEIRSREDAIRMLDRVCEYLERHEPANPAPLLIRRAQRLMRKNFVEIVQDLLPESLSQIESLAGLPRE
jgi:type VI secretion system protein ImpA